MTGLKPITIGLILILIAAVVVEMLFLESRQDPSLRIAALTIVGTLVTGILAIASTLMIGKDVTHQDLPPNSSMQQTTTLQTKTPPDPPATPPPLTPLASQIADASKEVKPNA